MNMKFTKSPFRRFREDKEGLISFEFIVLIPLFLFMIFTTYSLYNMFYKKTLSAKATATVSDLVSRQVAVDDVFITSLHDIFRSVAAARDDEETWIRVTSVKNDAVDDDDPYDLVVRWSEVRGNDGSELTSGSSIINVAIPTLFPQQSVTLVETSRQAIQIFSGMPLADLGEVTFRNRFTAPLRFSSNLVHLDNPQPDDPPLTN